MVGWEGERRGVASQPTKVSFRANKNRWIMYIVDGASYRTGLAEKSYPPILEVSAVKRRHRRRSRRSLGMDCDGTKDEKRCCR
uniref:Uncharacterized protein n=1 Tax=Timema genevievae TaxID=629358 RepID=A0A7R9K773_TIMGE|nr:unnamed protein product [Timema genevievae]